MIKIQKKDFNIENEITVLKNQYSNVGAINIFVGYVRDLNKNKNVKYINLEVYKDMAIKELSKIKNQALNKWKLVDCLILHRYGKLFVNDKIVLVVCLSEHRKDSFESCKFIMNFLKKDAPFWKKEFYDSGSDWLKNTN